MIWSYKQVLQHFLFFGFTFMLGNVWFISLIEKSSCIDFHFGVLIVWYPCTETFFLINLDKQPRRGGITPVLWLAWFYPSLGVSMLKAHAKYVPYIQVFILLPRGLVCRLGSDWLERGFILIRAPFPYFKNIYTSFHHAKYAKSSC